MKHLSICHQASSYLISIFITVCCCQQKGIAQQPLFSLTRYCDSVAVNINYPQNPNWLYSWNFGNGVTKIGYQVSGMRYKTPGQYAVSLTIKSTVEPLRVIGNVEILSHCTDCFRDLFCDLAGTLNGNPEIYLSYRHPANGIQVSTNLRDEATVPVSFSDMNGVPLFFAPLIIQTWDYDNGFFCTSPDLMGSVTVPVQYFGGTISSGDLTVAITTNAAAEYTSSQNIRIDPPPTAPILSASGPTDLCPSQSVTLTAANPCSNCQIVWSNGQIGNSIIVNQTGNYSAISNNNCAASIPSPSISVTTLNSTPPAVSCQNDRLTSAAAANTEWLDANRTLLKEGSIFDPPQAGIYYVRQKTSVCPAIKRFRFEPGCNIIYLEICNNNLDDDNDGQLDCADLDCSVTVTATNTGPYQVGNSINLRATATGEVKYLWSGPNGFRDSVPNPRILNAQLSMSGLYRLSVTSACGAALLAATEVLVLPVCNTVKAGINSTITGNTVAFSNTTSGGASFEYIWQFGDSTTATSPTLTHTYLKSGIYQVILTVKNECGNSATATVKVKIDNPPQLTDTLQLVAGRVAGQPNGEVKIPVTIKGSCGILTSLQALWDVVTPGIIEVTNVTPGAITLVNFNLGNGSFVWYGETNIQDTTVLFYLNAKITGKTGDSTAITFKDGNILEIEVSCNRKTGPIIVKNGNVKIIARPKLMVSAGNCSGQPLKDALITVKDNTQTFRDTTGTDGRSVLENLTPAGPLVVTVEKKGNVFNGLASAFWLSQMQRYLLGYEDTQIKSPCQVIAADFNGDNKVSAFDLLLISSAAVNGTPEPFQSWRFFPKKYLFPIPFSPKNVFKFPTADTISDLTADRTVDFTGVKTGDIGMKANPQNAAPDYADNDRSSSSTPFKIMIEPVFDAPAHRLTIDFRTTASVNIASLQMLLNFNAAFLKSIALEAGAIDPIFQLKPGQIPLLWYDQRGEGQEMAAGASFFRLVFETSDQFNDRMPLLDLIHTAENGPLAAELSERNNRISRPILVLTTVSSQRLAAQEDHLLSLKAIPNPARNHFYLEFNLSTPTTVDFQLVNALGQIVETRTETLQAGRNNLLVDAKNLPEGIYHAMLRTNRENRAINIIVQH